MKISKIILGLFLICISSFASSSYKKVMETKLPSNAIDIRVKKQRVYYLNDNYELISVDKNGKNKIIGSNITGFEVDENNVVVNKNSKLKRVLDLQVDKNLPAFKSYHYDERGTINIPICDFLTRNENMETIAIIGEGYSKRLVKINNNGDNEFIRYIQGIPAGLVYKNGKVWYLYNKSKKNKNAILQSINVLSGSIISDEELPVKDALGLDVDENEDVFTFAPSNCSIVKLSRSNK